MRWDSRSARTYPERAGDRDGDKIYAKFEMGTGTGTEFLKNGDRGQGRGLKNWKWGTGDRDGDRNRGDKHPGDWDSGDSPRDRQCGDRDPGDTDFPGTAVPVPRPPLLRREAPLIKKYLYPHGFSKSELIFKKYNLRSGICFDFLKIEIIKDIS